MNHRSTFAPEIPAWLNEILEGERLLSRGEQERFFNDLHRLSISRRVDPVANVLLHLTVAAIKHNRQILFLEKAVQRHCEEVMELKAKKKRPKKDAS